MRLPGGMFIGLFSDNLPIEQKSKIPPSNAANKNVFIAKTPKEKYLLWHKILI